MENNTEFTDEVRITVEGNAKKGNHLALASTVAQTLRSNGIQVTVVGPEGTVLPSDIENFDGSKDVTVLVKNRYRRSRKAPIVASKNIAVLS